MDIAFSSAERSYTLVDIHALTAEHTELFSDDRRNTIVSAQKSVLCLTNFHVILSERSESYESLRSLA